jgi:hypothetical protein
MRERWFGDDRDVAKWTTLLHLARSNNLATIVYAAYWRPEPGPGVILVGNKPVFVPDEVWTFFRDFRQVEALSDAPKIEVVDRELDPRDRAAYVAATREVMQRAPRPLLLFVDPDTGLAPKTANAEHVTREELREYWSSLNAGEWLVLYQHARREKNWAAVVAGELSVICDGAPVEVAQATQFGKDVAFLCVERQRGS